MVVNVASYTAAPSAHILDLVMIHLWIDLAIWSTSATGSGSEKSSWLSAWAVAWMERPSPSGSPKWWRISRYAQVRALSKSAQLRPRPMGDFRRVFFHDAGGMKPVSSSQKHSSSSV